MASVGRISFEQYYDDPWRWHERSSYIRTTRQLESVAESEWFHILAQIISSTLLFILIFGMSATVDVGHLREQVHNKLAILIGVATQFIIMPLLGYAAVMAMTGYGLTEPMAISLLIVTASPGGSYSNWWCSMFNADLALSVTMTAISTLISTVMLPANLLLYVNAAFGLSSTADSEESVLGNIDWASLFVSLAIVILAIALGLFVSFKVSSHRFNRFANRLGSISGVLLIIFSGVVSSLSGSNEAQIWGQPWSFYVGVTAPCLVGLCVATFFATIGGLKKPERISVGVECCYQNVGIATTAVVAMFDDPVDKGQALCVPLFYGLMEAIVLGVYCIIAWKLGWTKAPRNENCCAMMVATYEVDDDDDDRPDVVGEQMEGESQLELSSPEPVIYPDTWSNGTVARQESKCRRPWSLFGKRKRKGSEETQIPPASPTTRLESITQMDAITDLVSFPDQKGEYSRCRINSEDGTATTTTTTSEITPRGSPNSTSKSSIASSTQPVSLMRGTF
mmetsp:Transcript_6314/g.15704  ORF Transcript_6314/g.15704 Transcript_6314/m.15704 type:complete len:509 (-) Transcript_6314:40-1566(-)